MVISTYAEKKCSIKLDITSWFKDKDKSKKQNKKNPRNTFNQISEIFLQGKLQNTNERNHRWHEQMEMHPSFMNWKNKYHENDHTLQSNPQIPMQLLSKYQHHFSQN